ncbi:protein FAR1-RELATED SEQUENCE 1-like [Bidens hawaiensis]|uniref:protein FAR1-RELATED SEQUENCE 1-like n=1 Tax=Bidens hawaiensis TaxID=980011 RepID=UPI0040490F9A
MLTRLPVELHASQVYTVSIFKEVQKEIYEGLYWCSRGRFESDNGSKIHFVTHNDKRKRLVGTFKVTNKPDEKSFTCSCRLFTRIGYLCRHVFCVFKTELIDAIPATYIPTRWRNDAFSSSMFNIEYRYDVPLNERSRLRHEFITLTNQCIDRARGDINILQAMVEQMKQLKDRIWQELPTEPECNNKSIIIEDFLEVKEPETIYVIAPKGIRNKGSGTRKRKIRPGEKAKTKMKKKHRRECKKCKKLVRDHDSRNCEKVRKAREVRRQQQKIGWYIRRQLRR